jgi:DNA-binding beta-propeller fold protein YncE/mono/diheme cytochrome c family protein
MGITNNKLVTVGRSSWFGDFGVTHFLRITIFYLIVCQDCCSESQPWLAPTALAVSPDGGSVYVACAHARAVVVVNATNGAIRKSFSLTEPATGLAVSSGNFLFATSSGGKNWISVFDLATGILKTNLPARPGVGSPVVQPTRERLFVCNQFDHSVSVFDTRQLRELKRLPVGREPVASALTPDGQRLVVAHLLADGPADRGVVAVTASIIDPDTLTVRTNLLLPNGAISARGVAISPDGKWAAVAHQRAQFNVPATQVEMGWMNAAALSLIDLDKMTRFATILLDSPNQGAANPWALAWTPDGRQLLVTHAGTHELSVINVPALLAKLSSGEVNEDFSFIDAFRQRIQLPANGPRALVLAQGHAWVAGYFSDTLSQVSLESLASLQSFQLSAASSEDVLRQGERLFNDATLCRQGWQSCASCHPDGRADGLNWDLLNDGIGNPKNTKSMLLSHQTPPAMSLGVRETAEQAVRSGIRNILFALRPEAEARAIDAYLKSMSPTPSPLLAEGQLSPAAMRGKKLFTEAGCARCHPAPWFTDQGRHAVGTKNPQDRADSRFDTPTLVEIWRTAPYLHDGSAATLQEVLTTHNLKDEHGKTSGLSPEQIADLAAYVLSL